MRRWALPLFVRLVGLVAIGVTPSAALASAAGTPVPRAAVPAWVDEVTLGALPPPDGNAERGVTELLSDEQVHTGDGRLEWYDRRAFRVDTAAGVESSSELRFEFDPKFERLALHHVRVARGGRVVEALAGGDWRVMQPESDRDRRIYSDRLEGVLFLHDVRVGDVVDYASTLDDRGPLAPGRLAGRMRLSDDVSVGRLRIRVVVSDGRNLFLKLHGAAQANESTAGGDHVYLWDRKDVPAAASEDSTPGWYEPDPWLEVSDFGTWGDVAAVFVPLFAVRGTLSDPMMALVAGWKKLPTEAERVLAATTFVQDEIRYLGIEMGPHSHEPFSPNTVLSRRFGDCKDKALLLVTLLRAVGSRADVALVSTERRRALDERLPSPFVFDHAIVRVVVDGQVRWIDATESLARGPIAGREPPYYERALIVSPETRGLETIDAKTPPAPTYEVDETYAVGESPEAPVTLRVDTTYRGDDADEMRAHLARTPVAEVARQYINYYANKYPKIVQVADPMVTDDTSADVLIIHESYSIDGFFADGDRSLWPEAIEKELTRPRIVRRSTPLSVEYPRLVAHHTHVKMASAEGFAPKVENIADEAVRFHAKRSVERGAVNVDYRFEALSDYVAAEKVAGHLAVLDKIRDASELRIDPTSARAAAAAAVASGVVAPANKDDSAAWYLSFGFFAFVLAALAGVRLTRRWDARRPSASRKGGVVGLGEAASSAIPVRSEAEIVEHFAKIRCACGAATDGAAEPPVIQEARYGGGIVKVARTECRRCGAVRRRYFAVSS